MTNKDEKINVPINVNGTNIIPVLEKPDGLPSSNNFSNSINNNNYYMPNGQYYSYLQPKYDKNNFETRQHLDIFQNKEMDENNILKKLDNNDKSPDFFNMLNNDYDGANDQYYSYLQSLYDKNNFEFQQDLNAYQNKIGDDEQRVDENNDLYKLRIETIDDLQKIKNNQNIIMTTDHNEEFLCMNNNKNHIYIVIILFIFLIFLL